MTMPAARVGDMHACPMQTPGTPPIPHVGGPLVTPCPTVLICTMPAVRATAVATCVGPPDTVAKGSGTVLTGSLPQARAGDSCVHGGAISAGAPTVMVGG